MEEAVQDLEDASVLRRRTVTRLHLRGQRNARGPPFRRRHRPDHRVQFKGWGEVPSSLSLRDGGFPAHHLEPVAARSRSPAREEWRAYYPAPGRPAGSGAEHGRRDDGERRVGGERLRPRAALRRHADVLPVRQSRSCRAASRRRPPAWTSATSSRASGTAGRSARSLVKVAISRTARSCRRCSSATRRLNTKSTKSGILYFKEVRRRDRGVRAVTLVAQTDGPEPSTVPGRFVGQAALLR